MLCRTKGTLIISLNTLYWRDLKRANETRVIYSPCFFNREYLRLLLARQWTFTCFHGHWRPRKRRNVGKEENTSDKERSHPARFALTSWIRLCGLLRTEVLVIFYMRRITNFAKCGRKNRFKLGHEAYLSNHMAKHRRPYTTPDSHIVKMSLNI